MMGFFATFCGFIYNDMTSIPIYLFGPSCYEGGHGDKHATYKEDCTYPVGVDPIWYLAKNELTYVNSLKMKLAVIFGVAQMALGVCMKGLNSLYYKKPIDFIFEFIPQIVMLLALFGFMDLLIIVKWLTNYSEMTDAVPPSIISSMINMFLNFGELPPGAKDTPFFSNQVMWMNLLLAVALLCVPLMLFVKPFYELKHAQSTKASLVGSQVSEDKAEVDSPMPSAANNALQNYLAEQTHSLDAPAQGGGAKQHDFGEIFIH